MAVSLSRSVSLAEFLKLPETKPAREYINGEIIQKPMPKGRHSRLQGKLCTVINEIVEAPKIAYASCSIASTRGTRATAFRAFPELRCTFGGRSIVPDVTVFLWEHIAFSEAGEVPDDFKKYPDWTIEILSPEQKPNKVIGNILHCLSHGCQLGWFIDPDDSSILVFLPERQPLLLQGSDRLPTLDAIELELTVERVFSWLKMGK